MNIKIIEKLLFQEIKIAFEGKEINPQKVTKPIISLLIKDIKSNKKPKKWFDKLIEKLSDPLPDKYRHRKRPQNRFFPFKDTKRGSSLVNSGKYELSINEIRNNIVRVKYWIEFKHVHAYYTTKGIAGRIKSTGNWVNWWEGVIYKGDHGLVSAKDMFKQVMDKDILGKFQ